MKKEVGLGLRWEWTHSFWMIFILTPYTLPISYFYVGIRMHRMKWIVVGYLYLLALGGVIYVIRLYGNVYEEFIELGVPFVIIAFLNGVYRVGNVRREYLLYLVEHMDPEKRRELVEQELGRQDALKANVLSKNQMAKRQSAKTKFVMTERERNNDAKVINVNKATVREIALLPGIGYLVAGKIVELREELGVFNSFEDLVYKTGIKARLMEEAKGFMAFNQEDISTVQKELEVDKRRKVRVKKGLPGRHIDF